MKRQSTWAKGSKPFGARLGAIFENPDCRCAASTQVDGQVDRQTAMDGRRPGKGYITRHLHTAHLALLISTGPQKMERSGRFDFVARMRSVTERLVRMILILRAGLEENRIHASGLTWSPLILIYCQLKWQIGGVFV